MIGVLQLTSVGEVNIGKRVLMFMGWFTALLTVFLFYFPFLFFSMDTQFVFVLFWDEKFSWAPALSMPQVQCLSSYSELCPMFKQE